GSSEKLRRMGDLLKELEAAKTQGYLPDSLSRHCQGSTGAIDLLKRTQEMLAVSNLRLHKIASNCPSVLEAFPLEDHAKGLQDLNFDDGATFIQRTLGLCWDLNLDILTQFLQMVQLRWRWRDTRSSGLAVHNNKPFILVLTTVPPHTDSLGVSTKTKAGLVTEDDPLPF
ncbi:hypothetical protein NFI96_030091, partial [Prochilodus magdalenae]